MFFRTISMAAATAMALTGAPAVAATYNAHNFVHPTHSNPTRAIKFHKRYGVQHNRLRGAKGKARKNFGFDNASPGQFTTSGDTATLTGTLTNRAGQSYQIVMNFETRSDPGRYRNRAGASQTDWSFYTLTSGTLTSLSGDLANFDLTQLNNRRNGKRRGGPAVQFGTGANGINADLMGLFTRFRAVEQGCNRRHRSCQRFNGNLLLTLDEQLGAGGTIPSNASGATGLSDDGGVASIPLPASALLLPAALGGLGLAGAFGRRRKS